MRLDEIDFNEKWGYWVKRPFKGFGAYYFPHGYGVWRAGTYGVWRAGTYGFWEVGTGGNYWENLDALTAQCVLNELLAKYPQGDDNATPHRRSVRNVERHQ